MLFVAEGHGFGGLVLRVWGFIYLDLGLSCLGFGFLLTFGVLFLEFGFFH